METGVLHHKTDEPNYVRRSDRGEKTYVREKAPFPEEEGMGMWGLYVCKKDAENSPLALHTIGDPMPGGKGSKLQQ